MSALTDTESVSPCADLRARQPEMIPQCGSGVLLAVDAALREEPRFAFPRPSSSTREEEASSHTARESSTQKKTPPGMVGVSPYKLPFLSLERTSQHAVGQVSWLAAHAYSLPLPKV
jgi:hypothetical protein